MKAVDAAPKQPTFDEVFDTYLGIIMRVHGAEVAATYRQLREGEALIVLASDGVGYPDAAEQVQSFLSYHVNGD